MLHPYLPVDNNKALNHLMKLSPNTPEILRSITPLFLAAVGGVIGLCVLLPQIDQTKATAALGLASTAIAGAAGLAIARW